MPNDDTPTDKHFGGSSTKFLVAMFAVINDEDNALIYTDEELLFLIFGLVNSPSDGKKRYWVVAVQSSWYRPERMIFPCPVPIFAELVESMLDEAAEELEAERDRPPDEASEGV